MRLKSTTLARLPRHNLRIWRKKHFDIHECIMNIQFRLVSDSELFSSIQIYIFHRMIGCRPVGMGRWQVWNTGQGAGGHGENVRTMTWNSLVCSLNGQYYIFRDMWRDFILGKRLILAKKGRNRCFQNKRCRWLRILPHHFFISTLIFFFLRCWWKGLRFLLRVSSAFT